MAQESWIWQPHPGMQYEACRRQEKEMLLGGSRGPGKTEVGIILMAMPAIATDEVGAWKHPYYRGLVLRRHSDDLNDWVDRAGVYYGRMGAKKYGRPPEFKFPSGAKIRTGHLRDSDAFTKYQGHEYQRMCIEEVQLIPSEELYEKLMASCRSKYPDLVPQIILTANPGGPGHVWLRNRFVKVYRNGQRIDPGVPFKDEKTGHWRIFIPGTVDENPNLMENDPGYVKFLESLPPQLMKAWRYGDWDSFAGAFFSELRPDGPLAGDPLWANHVIKPVKLEPWWPRWISGDWGYDHPSVFHWFCLSPEGRIYVYKELYIRQKAAAELGVLVAQMSAADLAAMPQPHLTVALDPRCWAQVDEGRTIAQRLKDGVETALGKGTAFLQGEGDGVKAEAHKPAIGFHQADNQRVAGWQAVREVLRWQPLFIGEGMDEVLPKLQIFDTCPRLIDTLGILTFDENKPEDCEKVHAVNGEGGDDAADSLRYGIQAYKEIQNAPPLSAFVAEKLRLLRAKYHDHVDPTIAYMVAEHAEDQYYKQQPLITPVTVARMSSRRH